MTQYVGLDVSLKMTALCVVDETGGVTAEGKVASEPEALSRWLREHAPAARRIGMETGPLAVWLWNGLKERGLPVHVIDAWPAKAGLALQASKTDRNDARGLAEIARMGWYANVRVERLDAHALRAKLAARAELVATARDLGNQLRGLLRCFGLIVGKGQGKFEHRVLTLVQGCPALRPVPTRCWRRAAPSSPRSSAWTACCCARPATMSPAAG